MPLKAHGAHFLGIDVGTSSTKSVIVNEAGCVVSVGQAVYGVESPRPGWAEQHPHVWWEAVKASVAEAVAGAPGTGKRVAGVGVTGQMHGLVMLGVEGAPTAPAILWSDARAVNQVERVAREFGDALFARVGGPIASGFLLPSLLWVRDERPELYRSLRRVVLPKDFVRYALTGEIATDPTDAGGTGAYDPISGAWTRDLLDAYGLNPELFPPIRPSTGVAGVLRSDAAAELALPAGIPVATGCGDLQASAVGVGIAEASQVLVNIGSGGQVLQLMERYATDPLGRLHTMAYPDGERFHAMGATLAAGLALSWIARAVSDRGDDALSTLMHEASRVGACEEGLFFLPYLLGERTPHMDKELTAAFVGLRIDHGPAHLMRAVMEGVAFSLYDCYETMRPLTVQPSALRAGSGGLRAPLMRQLVADVFGMPLEYQEQPHSSALGAAVIARCMRGGSSLRNFLREANDQPPVTCPEPDRHEVYMAAYARFREAPRFTWNR